MGINTSKMEATPEKTSEKDSDIVVDEKQSNNPYAGPSNILRVESEKGKVIVVKREGDDEVEVEYDEEQPDLREFKERPIEKFKEASQKRYGVIGIEMETQYREMTESEEEREVAKLSPEDRGAYNELKDVLTMQARLKGKIPGYGYAIQTFITGRYPGVPSEQVKPYVVPAEGAKADIKRVPPVKIQQFIEEHDRKVPRRKVVARPGKKGVTMAIDPYSDDEIYEWNEMDDTLQDIVVVKSKKKGKRIESDSESESEKQSKKKPDEEVGESSKTLNEDKVLVPDVITEERAETYCVPKKEKADEDEETSDAETISSTSTADFDREEVEEIIGKISSCHTALAQHYVKLNTTLPHMTKVQQALYLGKTQIMPLIKTEEKPVTKTYEHVPPPSTATTAAGLDDTDITLQGTTPEEKVANLVDTVPATKIMLILAVADVVMNGLSHAQASCKYGFTKSRIQRAVSQNPAHRKGGRQYEENRKRKEPSKDEKQPPAKKPKSTRKSRADKTNKPKDDESEREDSSSEKESLPDIVL